MSFQVPCAVRPQFVSRQPIPTDQVFYPSLAPTPTDQVLMSTPGLLTPRASVRRDIFVSHPQMYAKADDRKPSSMDSMPSAVFRRSSAPFVTASMPGGDIRQSPPHVAVSLLSSPATPQQVSRQVSVPSSMSAPLVATAAMTDLSNVSLQSPKVQSRQDSLASTASTTCDSTDGPQALPTLLGVPRPVKLGVPQDREESLAKPTPLTTPCAQPTIPEEPQVLWQGHALERREASSTVRKISRPSFTASCTELKEEQSIEGHARQIHWLWTMFQQMVTEYEVEFAAKEKLEAKEAERLETQRARRIAASLEVERRVSLRLSREAEVAQNKAVAEEIQLRKIKTKQDLEVAREDRVAEDKKQRRAESARRCSLERVRKEEVRKEGERILQEKVAAFAEKGALKRSKSERIARDTVRIQSARKQTNPLVARLYESMKAAVSEQRACNVCDKKALQDHMEKLFSLALTGPADS